MSLQLEIGEGAENLRMKSKRWGFGKSWNSGLLDAWSQILKVFSVDMINTNLDMINTLLPYSILLPP